MYFGVFKGAKLTWLTKWNLSLKKDRRFMTDIHNSWQFTQKEIYIFSSGLFCDLSMPRFRDKVHISAVVVLSRTEKYSLLCGTPCGVREQRAFSKTWPGWAKKQTYPHILLYAVSCRSYYLFYLQPHPTRASIYPWRGSRVSDSVTRWER